MRVFVVFGAWLLGVGAATAGSLLAVSLLGQGLAPSTSQQLSPGAVSQALAAEATEATGPAANSSVNSSVLPSSKPRPRKAQSSSAAPSQVQAQPQAKPAVSPPHPSYSAQANGDTASARASASTASTVLTSQGGTVVAECVSPGIYLVSWSPTQGYDIGSVTRGPAVTTQVVFDSTSTSNTVTMVVSCPAGVPVATTTVGGGGDDGGGDE